MGMRRTILPSVACLALSPISKLSNKQHDFRKNVNEHKEVFLMFFAPYIVIKLCNINQRNEHFLNEWFN